MISVRTVCSGVLAIGLMSLAACSSSSGPGSSGSGGGTGSGGAGGSSAAPATGGTTVTGGVMAVGGDTLAGGSTMTGGATVVGGATVAGGSTVTAGTTAAGGITLTGGTRTTGETTVTGGFAATGGTTVTGGSAATGGTTATGGSTHADAGPACHQAGTLTAVNNGMIAWSIDGADNPTLTFCRGNTYTFAVTAPGHPFYIKTVKSSGTGNAYTNGVTGNGATSGNVTFVVPSDAPDTLFYDCAVHVAMAGTINIVN